MIRSEGLREADKLDRVGCACITSSIRVVYEWSSLSGGSTRIGARREPATRGFNNSVSQSLCEPVYARLPTRADGAHVLSI